MTFSLRIPLLLALLTSFAPLVSAQPAAEPSGHWEGTLQLPNGELAIEIDLIKNEKSEWSGTISIPAQSVRGLPLAAIAVKGNSVTFAIKGPPGDPRFEGTLTADAKSISGNLLQGGGSIPFSIKRTGDAKIEVAAKSTPIPKELEGQWEGSLDANGTILRLTLNMRNQPDGTATGSIVSVDQNGAEFPITTITAKESNLKLDVRMVGGSYDGDLKDGALAGQWTQGGRTMPLTFKRAAK